LLGKKVTILLLSEGTKKVRQLKLSKFFIGLAFILIMSIAFGLSWLLRDYRYAKDQLPHLEYLKKENKQQRVQLVTLAQKIDQISEKLMELKEFDHKLRLMVNLESGDENIQFFGIGGSDPTLLDPNYTVEKAHQKLVRLMHKSLENLEMETAVQINEKEELYRFLENQKSILACTPSIWPVRGWISSRFGYRVSPFTNEKEFHKGLDICTPMNAPIAAPADGVISSIGWDYGYGKILTIKHGYGVKSKYAHLAKTLVKKGQYVKRGQRIALVGKTGRTTGPHLHYEVHLNGVPLNPLRYILN
jgi:murein DD-endopeptidase MepM/ murein hydrolase activator NlpD